MAIEQSVFESEDEAADNAPAEQTARLERKWLRS